MVDTEARGEGELVEEEMALDELLSCSPVHNTGLPGLGGNSVKP